MVKLGILQMNAGGQELGSMGRGDRVTVRQGQGRVTDVVTCPYVGEVTPTMWNVVFPGHELQTPPYGAGRPRSPAATTVGESESIPGAAA